MHKFCLALLAILAASGRLEGRVLRVCADPNNLPFSNQRQGGFENRIAAILARELGADLEYTWWARSAVAISGTLSARGCVTFSLAFQAIWKCY
jgi:mxaJ protein